MNQISAMEEAAEKDELSMAELLRHAIGTRRRCCVLKFQAVWKHNWGVPMHKLSPSDFLCCRSMKTLPYRRGRCAHQDRGPSRGLWNGALTCTELDLFLPSLQEEQDSTDPPGPTLEQIMAAAKVRRRACFDGYADTDNEPAPSGIPSHTASEGQFHLPHDLLLFSVVLPHLPLRDIFRARAVCWLWRQILSSPLHLRRLAENPDVDRHRLVVQTSTPNEVSCLAVFDGDRWFRNPIPLPPFCLRAAAGGLFCFSFETAEGVWEDPVLLVGNPLTGQWRQLPPVFRKPKHHLPRGLACTMWADRSLGCYKIFVLHDALYMYDSLFSRWEKHRYRQIDFLSSVAGTVRRDCCISSSGLLHCLSDSGQVVLSYDMAGRCLSYVPLRDSEQVVLSYDMAGSCLSYVHTYGPSNMDTFQLQQPYSRLPTLVYCNDTVHVVARLRSESNMMCGRLPWVVHGPMAIWELHVSDAGNTGKWGWPVSVAPQDLLEGVVAGSDGTDFCVTTDGESTIYLVLPGGSTMLTYNVKSQAWSTLPGCPSSFLISFLPQPYYVPLLWPGPI